MSFNEIWCLYSKLKLRGHFPCHVEFRFGVQDVELSHQGERGVEGADHPLRGGVEVGAEGDAARLERVPAAGEGEYGVVEEVIVGQL